MNTKIKNIASGLAVGVVTCGSKVHGSISCSIVSFFSSKVLIFSKIKQQIAPDRIGTSYLNIDMYKNNA